MPRRDYRPPPSPPPPIRVEVVTLTVEDLEARLEAATVRGYHRAADERDQILRDLAARLDAPALKKILSTKEAGAFAGVQGGTVLKWISEGLPGVRRGRGYHIRRADLEEWLVRPR